MRLKHPGCFHVLVPAAIFALMLLALDFMLWTMDPLGIVAYHADLRSLYAIATPAPDGYRLAKGDYQFIKYRVSIGDDGFRAVQGNRGGACHIAFPGDSVTFGMGSDLSYVDVLAKDIPADVHNYGIPGYSISNILAELDTLPADGYVYLMHWNDGEGFMRPQDAQRRLPSALVLYFEAIQFQLSHYDPWDKNENLQTSIASVLARDDVLVFTLDINNSPRWIHTTPGIHPIPSYTSFVSIYDHHYDPEGARQVAAGMKDAVVTFAEQQCNKR